MVLPWIAEWISQISQRYDFQEPILDVGGTIIDAEGYKRLFPNKKYVTLNVDPASEADIIADAQSMKRIKSCSYGTVVSFETLEHIENPFLTFKEMSRVLRPTGYLIVTTVFVWPYHGIDYWRFTTTCIKMLMRKSGINPLEILAVKDPRIDYYIKGLSGVLAYTDLSSTGLPHHTFGLGIKKGEEKSTV